MTSREALHKGRFAEWKLEFRTYLKAKRGRASRLARYLGVSRQHVSRWFVTGPSEIPAWAAVTANAWQHRVVTPQADKAHVHVREQVVTPQADNRAASPGAKTAANA